MNRIFWVVAMCVLALTFVQRAAGQATLPPPLETPVLNAYDPSWSSPAGCVYLVVCGQQFSIGGSGAYVNRVRMGLKGANIPAPGQNTITTPNATCTFSVVITDHVFESPTTAVVSFGDILVDRNESFTVPPAAVPVPLLLDDAFPAVWLPSGTYYLVLLNQFAPPEPCIYPNPPGDGGPQLDWVLDTVTPSPTVGAAVGSAIEWSYLNDNVLGIGPTVLNGTFACELDGPILLPSTGGGRFERSRLVVAGPVTLPIGGPVQFQAGFLNAETGALLGPLQQVTLNPGQIESADLDLTAFVAQLGQRIEVQPVIVQSPNAGGAANPGPIQISETVQMLDDLTGFQAVQAPVPQPGTSGLGLVPQVLAGGQTMRFDVLASPFDSCVGQVSFNDQNGNALIPAVQVNLAPGGGTTVDLNADALGLRLGTRIEAQPVLTPTAPLAAVAQNSVCIASVEVFDHLSGRTWSHQDTMVGLPAVQTPAGGTPGTPGVPSSQ